MIIYVCYWAMPDKKVGIPEAAFTTKEKAQEYMEHQNKLSDMGHCQYNTLELR